MKLVDSRRLTGPNLVQARPGAVLDVELGPGESAERLVADWSRHLRALLEAVGWAEEETAHRIFVRGVSLACSAPVDALYAATELGEWALEQARADWAGESPEPVAEAAARLRPVIDAERNPRVVELTRAAAAHAVACLRDDDLLSLGLGAGSCTWPVGELPDAAAIDWDCIHDIPVALVTGTNGKTTTVRMIAAIAAAAGFETGLSSTDRIEVGGRCLEAGDWSGPGGARRVLRDDGVELAVLETARGGLLRRGLAVERAAVTVVTNVAADHLGEWGVDNVDELAEAKLVVARVAEHLVLNADDPVLVEHAASRSQPRTWFSLDADSALVARHVAAGGSAAVLQGEELVLLTGGERRVVARVEELPAAFGGAARFNLANALAAIGAARALGLSPEAMSEGLRGFRSDSADNPGRLNEFEIGGVRVFVDFAHNPHGLQALLDMARRLSPARLLVVIGQAGDRDDEAIAGLARAAAAAEPDRVIVKELTSYLRGRSPGEIPALLRGELLRSGFPEASIELAADEVDAARRALAWAEPGDLLLLTCHAKREALVAFLQARLGA